MSCRQMVVALVVIIVIIIILLIVVVVAYSHFLLALRFLPSTMWCRIVTARSRKAGV